MSGICGSSPSPKPCKSELRSSRPREERGEGEVIDRRRCLDLNSSRSRKKWIAFALPLPLLEQRANASILETRPAEGPNLDSLRLRYFRPHDRRCSCCGGGGAMPVHPGKARAGGLLSASGHCARRKAQTRADCGHKGVGVAAAKET